MLRTILGVVFGYIAMVIFVMTSFSLAYLVIEAETAYKPGNYEVPAFGSRQASFSASSPH